MAFVYGGTVNPGGESTGTAMEVDQNEDFDCLVYKSGSGELVGPEARASSVDDYLYCQVCKANFMTVKTAMVHYNGKPHQRTLTAIAENMGVLNVPTLGADGKPQKPKNEVVKATPGGPTFVEGQLSSGIFVDSTGILWGPEKNAGTLGEFKQCSVCGVTASSFKTAKEHYQGGKHVKVLKKKADENGLKFRSVGKKVYTAVAQGPTERDDDPLGVKADAEAAKIVPYGGDDDEDIEWVDGSEDIGEIVKRQKTTDDSEKYCNTCQIALTSKVVAELHYAGKKHNKNLEKLMLEDPKASSTGKYTLDIAASGEIPYCQPCELMCLSYEQLEDHLAGEEHKARIEEEKEKFRESVKSIKKDDPDEFAYGCRICDVKVTSKDNYRQHMESKKHMKKFNALQEKRDEERMKRMGPGVFRGGMRPPFRGGMRPPFFGGPPGPRGFSGFGPPRPPLGWGNSPRGPMGWGDDRPGWRDEGPGWGERGPGWREQGPGWRDQGPGWGKDDYAEYEWKGPIRGGSRGRGGPDRGGSRGRGGPDRGGSRGRGGPDRGGSNRGAASFPYKDVRLEDEPFFGSENRNGQRGRGRGGPGGPGGRGGRNDSPGPKSLLGNAAGGPSLGGLMDTSGGEDLTSSILKLLPKDAVMKLAMEALTSKSKEILANVNQSGGEGGSEWSNDNDYQEYNRKQGAGPPNQWGRGGRGRGRGFPGF